MRLTVFARVARAAALLTALPTLMLAQKKDLPLKYVGPPTKADITAGDLMTRLYLYADDSLMGRQFGSIYNAKATAYIEAEVRRMGLLPGGDNGTFFQGMPVAFRVTDTTATITVDGVTLKPGVDFLYSTQGRGRSVTAQVIYGGMALDTANVLSTEAVKGKFIMLRPFQAPPGFTQAAFTGMMESAAGKAYSAMISAAAGTISVGGAAMNPAQVRNALTPRLGVTVLDEERPVGMQATAKTAELLLGAPIASATKGLLGKSITLKAVFSETPVATRNVIAILPGSDPKLKGQYIAIGAHNDHVGFRAQGPLDHDSVKVANPIIIPGGADSRPRPQTPDETARIRAMVDSLHKLHGGPRPDSIYNGADDDGSGTVSVLELAEAFAKGRLKPKRSIVFVWHTGEEAGMLGSGWFVDHPTIPRDSIVAQFNMDMVGRGRATDQTGDKMGGGVLMGGPGYLQLVGSRRLSNELGDLIETVNKEQKLGFNFDYGIDANGHPQNIYCRSDHWSYARYGIPIVFMTTGGHADYHQVTDEPQYIDYDHMADISKLVYQTAMKAANLDHRIVVDKPKPDPKGNCQQ